MVLAYGEDLGEAGILVASADDSSQVSSDPVVDLAEAYLAAASAPVAALGTATENFWILTKIH